MSISFSSIFKLKSSQVATEDVPHRQNNNKHLGINPELLTLFAKSTYTSKGSVWWRELDKRGRGEGNMMKRETGRILHWRPWCSRPASNSARCLSFCLPACHPICQFSRDGEAARGAEMSGADAGAARGKSAGHRRSQLKVTWPFDFVTCHQLPCLTPHGGVPAIHHCFLLCLCLVVSLSLSLSLRKSFSVFFCLLLPLHLLFSFSLSFQSCVLTGKSEGVPS